MPAVMLSNACTPLGQVNGATGTAVGIVIDPTGEHTFPHKIMTITNTLSLADFFEVDDLYVMCTKPPACVLFKPDDSRIPDSGFQGLDGSIMPIFPLKKSERILDSTATNPDVSRILLNTIQSARINPGRSP